MELNFHLVNKKSLDADFSLFSTINKRLFGCSRSFGLLEYSEKDLRISMIVSWKKLTSLCMELSMCSVSKRRSCIPNFQSSETFTTNFIGCFVQKSKNLGNR
jgi:hypothetical protein